MTVSGTDFVSGAFTYARPPTRATLYLFGGYPRTSYSDAIATGGGGNYTYSITDGSLPAGSFLNSSTGAITGTTTGSGMSFFEVIATTAWQSASALYSITISTNPASGFNMWPFNVVWHELGHAMEIGKFEWDSFAYLVGAGTADPPYFGAGAVAEYSTLLGGPARYQGVTNAISWMTIMSLFDVGWSVDLTAADAYSLMKASR